MDKPVRKVTNAVVQASRALAMTGKSTRQATAAMAQLSGVCATISASVWPASTQEETIRDVVNKVHSFRFNLDEPEVSEHNVVIWKGVGAKPEMYWFESRIHGPDVEVLNYIDHPLFITFCSIMGYFEDHDLNAQLVGESLSKKAKLTEEKRTKKKKNDDISSNGEL